MHVKLSKYAVNNYPHLISFCHFPSYFVFLTFSNKNKYRIDVGGCRQGPSLFSLLTLSMHFSLRGHRSVVSHWMIFWSTCMFLFKLKIFSTSFKLYFHLKFFKDISSNTFLMECSLPRFSGVVLRAPYFA